VGGASIRPILGSAGQPYSRLKIAFANALILGPFSWPAWHVWRRRPDPGDGSHRERGTALHEFSLHVALLAHAGGDHHRPQPIETEGDVLSIGSRHRDENGAAARLLDTFGTRAFPERAESGDSYTAANMIQAPCWEEASMDGEAVINAG